MNTPEQWMENAQLRLEVARFLFKQERYGLCVTQLYFAVFAASKALLVSRGVHQKSHGEVHHDLYKTFGHTVDTRLVSNLRKEREAFDYELLRPDRAHIEQRLPEAEHFVTRIATLL